MQVYPENSDKLIVFRPIYPIWLAVHAGPH